MVVGAQYNNHGNNPHSRAVYTFTLQGETRTEDKLLTARDAASSDKFGNSFAISIDMVLVGTPFKDGNRGAAYVFVLGGDGSWDEGTRLIRVHIGSIRFSCQVRQQGMQPLQ